MFGTRRKLTVSVNTATAIYPRIHIVKTMRTTARYYYLHGMIHLCENRGASTRPTRKYYETPCKCGLLGGTGIHPITLIWKDLLAVISIECCI